MAGPTTPSRSRSPAAAGRTIASLTLDGQQLRADLSREDWLGLLVDREATSRDDKRLARRLRGAKLRQAAVVEDTDYRTPRGLDRALEKGVRHIAIFGSATETFAQRNLNRTLDEQLAMFERTVRRAREHGLDVRAYVSMCFGDPWEGAVDPAQVADVAARLHGMGCGEVSLGDTIGVGTPGQVHDLLQRLEWLGHRVTIHDPLADADEAMHEYGVSLEGGAPAGTYDTVVVAVAHDAYRALDAEALGLMRDGAVLVNTGRGEVVDEDALVAELRSGRLSAALDVFATEPLAVADPLRSTPRTVLTPRTGASSAASVAQLREAMCTTTLQWLTTGWADAVVNPHVRERLRRWPTRTLR